jgi:hypothetical protein
VLKARRLGVGDDEIARRMHWKSVASVKQHLDMLEILPEPIKQRIREGKESATFATQLEKENPELAAELRRANEEENKKLGIGQRPKKLKPKDLRRAKQEPAPKPPEPPKEEAKAEVTSALAATSETTTPVHEQLRAAEARENGQVHSPLSDNAPPAASTQSDVKVIEGGVDILFSPSDPGRPPARIDDINKKLFEIVGKLCVVGEDNCLNERDDSETIPVPVSLMKSADKVYRSLTGDV